MISDEHEIWYTHGKGRRPRKQHDLKVEIAALRWRLHVYYPRTQQEHDTVLQLIIVEDPEAHPEAHWAPHRKGGVSNSSIHKKEPGFVSSAAPASEVAVFRET